jgi:flagellar biosynthesis protein FlhA
VQRVLQQLLREQVSIRDLGSILEVLVESVGQSKNIVHLVESVRQSLGRSLVHPLLDAEGGLRVLTLEHLLESEIVNTFDPQRSALLLGDGSGGAGRAPAEFLRRMVESVKRLTGAGGATATPVLLCPSPARYHLRRWLEPFLPKVVVLAPAEIPAEVRVRSIGTVS